MEYENMKVMEVKALVRDCGLRNYSRMRKAELVALLQNNPPPAPRTRPPRPTRSSPPPPHMSPSRAPPRGATWEPTDDRRLRQPPRIAGPTQQEMDVFERQEMSKSRSQVKSKLNK